MSINRFNLPITTDGSGNFTGTVRGGGGILHAIVFELGDLSTPDILIKEQPANLTVLNEAGVAADSRWYPQVAGRSAGAAALADTAPVVVGRLVVAISGAGTTKSGHLAFYIEN